MDTSLEFDKRKTQALIEKDQFLTFIYREMRKTKEEDVSLRLLFNLYILDDEEFELEYRKIK